VLDIFPAHTPQQIRHYLEHPAVDGNPELLISSLLEGTLPSELVDDVDAVQDNVHPKEEFEFIKDRRNAWDEDTMDFSRLRVGKTRYVAWVIPCLCCLQTHHLGHSLKETMQTPYSRTGLLSSK
jgi:hypothetical protein